MDRVEVAKHNKASDCYLVIDNIAYDVTKFLPEHPGGEEVMLELAGNHRDK
jgi:cytochrome b involved in lipid metabolism